MQDFMWGESSTVIHAWCEMLKSFSVSPQLPDQRESASVVWVNCQYIKWGLVFLKVTRCAALLFCTQTPSPNTESLKASRSVGRLTGQWELTWGHFQTCTYEKVIEYGLFLNIENDFSIRALIGDWEVEGERQTHTYIHIHTDWERQTESELKPLTLQVTLAGHVMVVFGRLFRHSNSSENKQEATQRHYRPLW